MNLAIQTATQQTISSLDLLGIVNQVRAEEGKTNLRHDNLMAKIQKELGEVALKFQGYYIAENGKENPCYFLPEREACLVVMSESPKVRAMVYDRMRSLEAGLRNNIDRCVESIAEAVKLLSEHTVGLLGKAASTEVKIENLEDKVDQQGRKLDNVVQFISRHSPKRRNPRSRDRELVLSFTRSLGSCPCCFQPRNNLVVDHFYSSQRPELQYIWAICSGCNDGLAQGRIDRVEIQKLFDVYHHRARTVGAFEDQKTFDFAGVAE